VPARPPGLTRWRGRQGAYWSVNWDKIDDYTACAKRVALAVAAAGGYKTLVVQDLVLGDGPVRRGRRRAVAPSPHRPPSAGRVGERPARDPLHRVA
jgi:hypothetical protein